MAGQVSETKEYRIGGVRVILADWMQPDEVLVIPGRRTLESDEEYMERCKSQAVLMRDVRIGIERSQP